MNEVIGEDFPPDFTTPGEYTAAQFQFFNTGADKNQYKQGKCTNHSIDVEAEFQDTVLPATLVSGEGMGDALEDVSRRDLKRSLAMSTRSSLMPIVSRSKAKAAAM